MNKFYTCIWLLAFCSACKMETMLLANNKTQVPVKPSVYQNRQYFDKSLLQLVDTNAIYVELEGSKGWLGVYKFYSNGNVNWFILKDLSLSKQSLDPNYTGYRGVLYKKKGKITADLFAEVNELGRIGRLVEYLQIRGDTLIVDSRNGELSSRAVYTKRALPTNYQPYYANW